MKLTLKTKTTLLVAALVVSLLAAVGYSRNRQLSRDFLAELHEQQDALADMVAEGLADKLALHLAVLEHTASQVTPEMIADPAAAQRFLMHDAATLRFFDGTTLIGLNGQAFANDPPLPPGKVVYLGDRDYFRQVLATDRPVIGKPLALRVSHGISLVMAAPVHDAGGRIVAVAVSGMQLGRPNILGQLSASPVGKTGHFELVTTGPHPVYVLHPDPTKTLAAATPIVDVRPGERGDVVTRRLVRGVDWELRAVLPSWEAWAPIESAQQSLLWQLSVLGVVSAALAWLGMHLMLQPLSRLHAAIRTLRQSPSADVAIDTRSHDERGDLARDFVALMRELRMREVELRAVTEASPLGFFRADASGDLTYVNEAYLRQHGLTRAEAPRGWLRLIPPAQRDELWQRWTRIVAGSEPTSSVNRALRDDGRELEFAVQTAPLKVDGRIEGHVGTVEDITDRVAAEKAMRVLTAIFDATPDLVVQSDRRGAIVYMNGAARRAFGLAADASVAGLQASDLVTEETATRLRSEIVPTVERHDVWLGETNLHAGGRELPVSHMVLGHRDRAGRMERFSSVMRDISAEQAAKQALQLQTATLRFVTEATPAIVVVIGADLRYRFVNGAFERWYGVAREQVVGRPLAHVLPAAEYERMAVWMARALAGETVVFEEQYGRVAGSRYLSLSLIPLRLDDGGIDGVVGIGQDITAHREKESRLLELSQTDPLTGVMNRAGFERFIERCVSEDGGPGLALLYVDLDHFKAVNDSHGHAVGDDLLRAFATRLRGLVRPTDAIARLGGDEFAIALCGVREAVHAESVADKVLRATHEPYLLDAGLRLSVGASVGVAVGVASDGDWRALLQRADGMLYRAKHNGRGRQASSALH